MAGLIGISNTFDDAYVEEYDKESKGIVIKSGDLRVKIKSQNFKAGDKVSWGIHPENITILLHDPSSENQNNTYSARIDSIINKGPKTRLVLKFVRYNKTLTAELPVQFVDFLNLNAGDLFSVELEMSKVVAFQS